MKTDIIQDLVSFPFKGDMLENDVAPQFLLDRDRIRRFLDRRRLVENAVDASGRSLSALEEIDRLPQCRHRPGKHPDVSIECDEASDGKRATRCEDPSIPEQEQD